MPLGFLQLQSVGGGLHILVPLIAMLELQRGNLVINPIPLKTVFGFGLRLKSLDGLQEQSEVEFSPHEVQKQLSCTAFGFKDRVVLSVDRVMFHVVFSDKVISWKNVSELYRIFLELQAIEKGK